jgi:Baseplate J-like protein
MSAAIPYQAGDFASFRRALLRPLPGEQAINDWRPVTGDLGLQVLEWWAYLADVLSFYNERYANESYLSTATQPGNIANQAAMLGYQPTPGIAATGTLAAISSARQSADLLVLPAGMSVSSTAAAGIPSQVFEVDSVDPFVTFTGPSTVPVALPSDRTLKQDPDNGSPLSVLIAGRVSGVKAGDRLVLVDRNFTGADDFWSLVTVAALTPATDPATGVVNTVVSFRPGGWGPTPPPAEEGGPPPLPAGEGAPVVPVPPQDSTCYRLLRPTAAAAIINAAELSGPNPQSRHEDPIVIIDSERATVQRVHLSAAVRAISPGDLVLFDLGAGNGSALAVVTATSEALWMIPFPSTRRPRPPDIIVAHTVLDLATEDFAVLLAASGEKSLGSIAVRYGWQDVGTIIGVPQAQLKNLGQKVAATYSPPAGGTPALLQDATGAGVPVTVLDAGSGKITIAASGTAPSAVPASMPLTPPLAVPLRLLLNLVPVSRGKTVSAEVLGSGNAALASQSFTLAKSPLTYLPGAAGIESTLTVTVNQIGWQEVPSFYGQPASARVFVVSRSADQTVTTVTFGDGVNGARLPSGTGNVVASYRYGSGQATPPAGLLTMIGQPQLNLASIQNPVPVSGGQDPQTASDVQTAAPASVATLGRAISATDYEQIAAQAPGVNQAAASWTFDRTQQRTLVTVYVSGGPAAVTAAITALAGTEDPNRPVVVTAANPIELSLSCELVVADGQQVDAVLDAAQAAVGGLFGPSGMGLGQRLYRTAIDAALLVPGVTAVRRLEVTGPGQALGEVLDPGPGAYFDLPPDQADITAVNGDD